MRNRLTGAVAAVAVTLTAVSGCGSTMQAELAAAPAAGAAGQVGEIAVRNLFVLGNGTDGTLSAGGNAPVYFNLVDQPAVVESMNSSGDVEGESGGDVLEAVTSPQATSSRLIGGPIKVPAGANVQVGPAAKVVLDGLKQPLSPANDVQVTLRFQKAGSGTFTVPVLPQDTYWKSYSPAPAGG